MRRFWFNYEKIRSTTHLRGNTLKPRGGISLGQSIFSPSFAHSSAQILATFSGMGLAGLRTTSTLRPKTSSAHLLHLPSYPASSHRRYFRRVSPVHADFSRSLSPSWGRGPWRWVLLGFEDQSFGIHQQVPLPAVDLLAAIVAPLLTA